MWEFWEPLVQAVIVGCFGGLVVAIAFYLWDIHHK